MENHNLFNEERINLTVELEKFSKLEEKIKEIVSEKVSLKNKYKKWRKR